MIMNPAFPSQNCRETELPFYHFTNLPNIGSFFLAECGYSLNQLNKLVRNFFIDFIEDTHMHWSRKGREEGG